MANPQPDCEQCSPEHRERMTAHMGKARAGAAWVRHVERVHGKQAS